MGRRTYEVKAPRQTQKIMAMWYPKAGRLTKQVQLPSVQLRVWLMTRSYSLSNKKQAILRVDKQLMGIQALDTWGKTMFVVSEGPHGTSIPSAPTGCPLAGAPGKSIWTIHSFFTLSSLKKKKTLELRKWIRKVQINQFWIIFWYFHHIRKGKTIVVVSLWCALSQKPEEWSLGSAPNFPSTSFLSWLWKADPLHESALALNLRSSDVYIQTDCSLREWKWALSISNFYHFLASS